MKINELMALRVQEFLWCEHNLLVAVQDIQKAMETRAEFEDEKFGTVNLTVTESGLQALRDAKLGGEVKAGDE